MAGLAVDFLEDGLGTLAQQVFGYPEPTATALMLDVHHKGKAAVSSGDKDTVEGHVAKLHASGLWATMQRA